MFASKTPRDLNHDPHPSRNPYDGSRWRDDGGWDEMVYDPRPEFDHVQHNEPNPMLVRFRETGHKADHYLWISGSPASTEVRWGVEESKHARKVLTRLAQLQAVSS